MKLNVSREVNKNLTVPFILGIFAFVFSLRDLPGSDIEIGRNHLLEGSGNNLLGAWSSWFYSIFPNTFTSWHLSLIFFQITVAVFGIFLVISCLKSEDILRNRISFYLIAYFIIDFASQQSRDGSMMAFIIFSIGLWCYAVKFKKLKTATAFKILSTISLIIAFTFRPWLAFSLLPIFYFLLNEKRNLLKKLTALTIVLVAPIAIENITFKSLNMENWYPQQTVMIHDLVTTYCWNSSLSTRELAWEGLDSLATSNFSKREVCQAYKPNTWQAVVAVGASTDSGLPPLRTLEANNDREYGKLKNYWIRVIASDPFSYVQNHIMFSTQVLIAGETRGFSIFSLKEHGIYAISRSIWKLPGDLAKTLHLTSPVIAILFYLYLRNKYLRESKTFEESDLFAAILVVWIGITSIGYVSDNGRYTLVPVLILYLITLTNVSLPSSFKKGVNLDK